MASVKHYDLRATVVDQVRNEGTAINLAKVARSQLEHWTYASGKGTNKMIEKDAGFKEVEGTINYLENKFPGSSTALSCDNISFNYNVFGDVTRQAVLGQNTEGIAVRINWENHECEVKLHQGEGDTVVPNAATTNFLTNKGVNKRLISEATGWNVSDTRDLAPGKVRALCELMAHVSRGQDKYTRLVKGFMLYIDLLHQKSCVVEDYDIGNPLEYKVDSVLAEFANRDTAYVYCDTPENVSYKMCLYMMCQEYPNPRIASNAPVMIPADGKRIVMVMEGTARNNNITAMLTPSIMYASILRYAKYFNIADQMESALVTACSLMENRYLSHVSLPQVNSKVDLLPKAVSTALLSTTQSATVTKESACTLGRLHQMQMMLLIKDAIISAEASTTSGLTWEKVVSQYMSSQHLRVSVAGTYMCDLKLLDMTPRMRWLTEVSVDDLEDLACVSIFECLWLADDCRKASVDGGVVQLKQGYADNEGSPYVELLKEELNLAGVTYDESQLPRGGFVIMARSVSHNAAFEVRRRKFVTVAASYTMKLSDRERRPKKQMRQVKRRSPRIVRTKATPVVQQDNWAKVEPVRGMSPDKRATRTTAGASSQAVSSGSDSQEPSSVHSQSGSSDQRVGASAHWADEHQMSLNDRFERQLVAHGVCGRDTILGTKAKLLRAMDKPDIVAQISIDTGITVGTDYDDIIRNARLGYYHNRRGPRPDGGNEMIVWDGADFTGNVFAVDVSILRFLKNSRPWLRLVEDATVPVTVLKTGQTADKAKFYAATCGAGMQLGAIARIDPLLDAYFSGEIKAELYDLPGDLWHLVDTKVERGRPYRDTTSMSNRPFSRAAGEILSIAIALGDAVMVIERGLFKRLKFEFQLSKEELRFCDKSSLYN